MGAAAVLVAAIGSALRGGEFEAEIKAPSLAFRMRAWRMPTNSDGTDSQHSSTHP